MKRKSNLRKSEGIRHGVVSIVMFVSGSMAMPGDAVENMYLHGALVAEPCVIAPGDEDVRLDFGSIVDKYLYLNTRTYSKTFELRLSECDVSIGKTVKIHFTGTENIKLPGLLAIDESSEAKGIAIGLETKDGKPLALNAESEKLPLQEDSTLIELQAYIQAEKEAIYNGTIGRGSFNAVTTFNLEYE